MSKIKLTEPEEKEIKEGFALRDLTLTEGYLVLREYLEGFGKDAWFDPTADPLDDSFKIRYTAAWAAKKTALEIIDWIASKAELALALEDKRKGKEDKTRVGS